MRNEYKHCERFLSEQTYFRNADKKDVNWAPKILGMTGTKRSGSAAATADDEATAAILDRSGNEASVEELSKEQVDELLR